MAANGFARCSFAGMSWQIKLPGTRTVLQCYLESDVMNLQLRSLCSGTKCTRISVTSGPVAFLHFSRLQWCHFHGYSSNTAGSSGRRASSRLILDKRHFMSIMVEKSINSVCFFKQRNIAFYYLIPAALESPAAFSPSEGTGIVCPRLLCKSKSTSTVSSR